MIERPTTISFINQKGGCGKSSCCFHLSGTLAQMGYRVLLIDADPQGSLSQAFFGPVAIESLSAADTLANLFDDSGNDCQVELIVPTVFDGIHIVRANHTLARHNTPRIDDARESQLALSDFIQQIAQHSTVSGFDVVLIDCPPNIYLCAWVALLAADFVMIPVPPEDFGTQGLRIVHQAIAQARVLNPRLGLLGQLITRSDRRLLVHHAYEKKLRDIYGDIVFETVIPEASAFKVALTARTPVAFHKHASQASQTLRRLADEMLDRISLAQRRADPRHDAIASQAAGGQ